MEVANHENLASFNRFKEGTVCICPLLIPLLTLMPLLQVRGSHPVYGMSVYLYFFPYVV